MRLTYLTLCLCAVALTACSHAPVTSQSNSTINTAEQDAQRATKALNSVYQQPSFNFNGRLDANLDVQTQNTQQTTTPATVQPQHKALIENYLRLHALQLSEQEKQQLFALTLPANHQSNGSLEEAIAYVLTFIPKSTELGYQGGIDYRKKLFHLELNAKYHTANTLLHHRYPVLVDFNQSRIYLNHFDPNTLTGKAKQNYQAYYYDFSKHKDTTLKSVNWKNILEYLKASNTVYFDNLVGTERIERLTPTDAERQQGAVEKIRLHTSIEALLAKNIAFDTVNNTYQDSLIDVAKVVETIIETEQQSNAAKNKNITKELSEADKAIELRNLIAEHYSQLEDSADSSEIDNAPDDEHKQTAAEAAAEATIAATGVDESETEDEQITAELSEEECRALIAKKAAFGRLTECRYEYGAGIYQANTAKATHSSDADDIKDLALKVLQMADKDGDFYQTFQAYDKGQLITGKAFSDIINKHQDVIQNMVKDSKYPIYFDVTLDKQGRLIHNNITIQLDSNFNPIKVKGTLNYSSHISNYGQAKIDISPATTQAKPIQEHPLMKAVLSQADKYTDKVNHQRYASENAEELANKLIEQSYLKHKSYEQAYTAGFIALLTQLYPEMLDSVSAQDLQEIARVYAYSYADEAIYKPTIEQSKAIQALEKKHQLHSSDQMFNSLGYDVASLVENVIAKHTISAGDVALVKKYKTPDALFTHIYQQKFIEEEYGNDKPSAEDQKLLKETANILAKAYMASQNKTLSLDTIKALKLEHEDFIYTSVYLDSVLETERLLKLVKK